MSKCGRACQSVAEHKRATWLNHISSNASSSDLEGCDWIACVIWDQVKDIRRIFHLKMLLKTLLTHQAINRDSLTTFELVSGRSRSSILKLRSRIKLAFSLFCISF